MKKTLINALRASGEVLLEHFGSVSDYGVKGRDIVTIADQESESLIKDLILAEFPDHNLLGEEGTSISNGSDYSWVIDPLDGTKNYAHGLPFFCVSIGLLKGDGVVLGGVYAPLSNELFIAEQGKGAFLNGECLKVNPRLLSDATLVCDFGHYSSLNEEQFIGSLAQLLAGFRMVRYLGCTVLAACYVAKGVFDAYINLEAGKWDKVACSLIVSEAGGIVSSTLESGEPIFVGSSIEVYDRVREMFYK